LILKSNIIMEKVRIMLAAIAVLGVVGGALAFKTKRSSGAYCYGPCPTRICTTGTPLGYTAQAGEIICYTSTFNTAACPGFTKCITPALTIIAE
jgi:hypothetical protein